jgi:hypothetical protein
MVMKKGLWLMLLLLAIPNLANAGKLCVTQAHYLGDNDESLRKSQEPQIAPMFVDGFDSPVKPQKVITQFRCGEIVTIWAYDAEHGYYLVGGSITNSYSRGITSFVSASYMQMTESEEDDLRHLSSEKNKFILAHPCPSTGKASAKKCPGYYLGFHLVGREIRWDSVDEDRKRIEEIGKKIQSQKTP